MNIKRTPKRPMIWTGDLAARHFQAKPVDLSIEFQMEAVKMLDDLESLWKKFEAAFWKRFIPMMNKEIDTVTSTVEKWDPDFPTWKPDQQKAAQQKLNDMTRAMGERVKAAAQKFSAESFAEVMKGVDNTVAKAKVVAVVKVSWSIAAVIAKVASVVEAIKLPVALLKAKKELESAQQTFKGDWSTLEAKANSVRVSATNVGNAYRTLQKAKTLNDAGAAKGAMDKLRDAGKKLQADVDAMDVYIAATRKTLRFQEKQITDMESALKAGKIPDADKAQASIKEWRSSRDRCAVELKDAAEAKQAAAEVQKQLAGATVGDESAFIAATRKVNGAAEKILKADDTYEKGKSILDAVDKIAKLVG